MCARETLLRVSYQNKLHGFPTDSDSVFKGLRLSALSASKTGSGYLVNLLSNDVGRLDMGFIFAHYIWILPIQVCIQLSHAQANCRISRHNNFFIFVS